MPHPTARRSHPLIEPVESRQLLAAGALDPTFGAGGKLQLGQVAPGLHLTGGGDVIALPGGKSVLLAGDDDGSASHLVRLNADGSLDTTFGVGGVATADGNPLSPSSSGPIAGPQALDETPVGMIRLPDGKYLVAGRAYGPAGADNFYLAQFNADGAPDTAFGVSGIKKFTFDNGNGHVNRSAYLAAQSDGKIVLVGTAKRAGADAFAQDIAVLRLNADGTPDASFGNNGQVIRTGGAGGNFATDLVIQPDGKILVAGGNMVAVQTGMGDGYTGGAGFVWRLNADGSTDTSFGNGGTVSLGTPAGTHGVVERIALAPDGTIVGVSNAWNGNDVPPATVVYKLNAADGSPVGNGGTGTIVATGRGINRILVAPDAKIYLAGLTRDGAPAQDGPLDFDVIRLNADLSLDTSFANAGDFRTSFGPTGADDQATALALTADGKLIVAGVAPDASATVHGGDLAVLRLDLGAPAANPQSRRSPKRIAMEQAAQQSTTGSKRSPKRIALEEAAKSATGSKRSPKRVAMETAAIEQAIADARAAGSTRSAKQIAHDALAMFSTTRIS